MNNPYRTMGYTATLNSSDAGDFLTIRKYGVVVCEVGVSVFPAGPDAPARMLIKRFRPDEFRSVHATDDFEDD